MLVRFGTTIINNGWRKDLAKNDYDLTLRFFNSKFKNIISMVDKFSMAGWTHLRLPNMIPNVDLEIIESVLSSKEMANYKDKLLNLRVTFSHHNSYFCNNITDTNKEYIIEYNRKVTKVVEHLGIESMTMCNHINKEDIKSVIRTVGDLKKSMSSKEFSQIGWENSEYGFDIEECLVIGENMGMPVIFDNLHHRVNNNGKRSLSSVIKRVCRTWPEEHTTKMHYSNGDSEGKHNSNLNIKELKEILDEYKKGTEELIIIVELRNAREIIENLKYLDVFDWNNDLTINY